MNAHTLTIDTGTTNTRVCLWDEHRELLTQSSAETGVRNTAIDGHNGRLKAAVRSCMEEALAKANIGYDAVGAVIASGMITSDVGLAEIPHVPAPAGAAELARAARMIPMPDICPLPILFIPGVKNAVTRVTHENFEEMDMMRGEETECIAMLDKLPKDRSYLLVLPGSHTKFVSVDEAGRLCGCLTTISGELLSCITHDTVIADSVKRRFVGPDDYDRDMLLRGFRAADAVGLGRAAFSARILGTFAEKDSSKLANFILGAVLAGDVQALSESSAIRVGRDTTVVVSGRDPLRTAISDILKSADIFSHVEEFTPDASHPLSSAGALLVADMRERCGD